MKRFLLTTLLLLTCAAQSYGQVQLIAPNVPIKVAWDYDAPTGTNFAILVDGQIVKNFATAELTIAPNATTQTFEYQANIPGLKPGRRVLKVRASLPSDSAVFTDSDELAVDVAPTKPGGLKIILSPNTNGEVEIELRAPGSEGEIVSSTSILKFPTIIK